MYLYTILAAECRDFIHLWLDPNEMSGGNKYVLLITVKFDQSTRRSGSFARLFKLAKHITLLFYLLSPYLRSCMRRSRYARKNVYTIKTTMKYCARWSTVLGMTNSEAGGIRTQ